LATRHNHYPAEPRRIADHHEALPEIARTYWIGEPEFLSPSGTTSSPHAIAFARDNWAAVLKADLLSVMADRRT